MEFITSAFGFIRSLLLIDIFSWLGGFLLVFALACFFLSLFSARR